MKIFSFLACLLLCFSGIASAAEGLTRGNKDGPYVYYKGTVTVSGTFSRSTDREILEFFGDRLCFHTDKASAALIPANPVNGAPDEPPSFCFSNTKTAMRLLKVPGNITNRHCGYRGKATVTITGFVADLEETATFDTAKLIRVISKTKPEPISCDDQPRDYFP